MVTCPVNRLWCVVERMPGRVRARAGRMGVTDSESEGAESEFGQLARHPYEAQVGQSNRTLILEAD